MMDPPIKEKKGEIVAAMERNQDPIGGDDIMIDIDVVRDDLLFSDDLLASLPDFTSPSASSTSNFLKNPSLSPSSSSSPSSAWSFLNQTQEPSMQNPRMGPTALREAVADIFGHIEQWDPSNPLDPSTFFLPCDFSVAAQEQPTHVVEGDGNNNVNNQNTSPSPSLSPNPNPTSSHDQELSKVFLEWLKSNRDSISPQDLKNIKLKTSTVECAAAHLGGGKQGKMQLLKLILTWVQNHHLKKMKRRGNYGNGTHDQQPYLHYQFAPPNPNPNPNIGYHCVVEPWSNTNVNYVPALPSMNAPPPRHPPLCAPYGYYPSASSGSTVINGQHFSHWADLHAFSPNQVHRFSPFHSTVLPHVPQYPGGYSLQYPMCPSFSLAGASSATKEARKRRMAQQRRNSTLHRHRIRNQNQRLSEKASIARAVQSESAGNSLSTLDNNNRNNYNSKNCGLWSRQKNLPAGASPSSVTNMHQPRNVGPSEKRQALKSEKNLKFLLQKVLKQSDVGSLGRIVLPKKEAETHLPVLDARDGIPILMDDVGTSRIWNMRYRYWPNNKSRMYLLENTGDFVRSNGLQEGDFIVIYADVKHNKYMIRGVKVRQPVKLKGAATRRQKRTNNSDQVHASSTFAENIENSMGELPPRSETDGDASPSKIMVDDM